MVKYILLFLAGVACSQSVDTSRVLTPSDLTYEGAFRLPTARAGSVEGFNYTIGALTYTPHGDSLEDGYPGALVIAGHTREHMTARISIPAPVPSRVLGELPRAIVLDSFRMFGTFPPQQQRLMALEEIGDTTYVTMTDGYLPTNEQLPIMSWGPRSLESYGPMRWVGGDRIHCFGDYMFQLPKWWSDRYAPGRFLAMGRHRYGDLCGQGPAVYAMNPHADTTAGLSTVPMLRYLQYSNVAGEGGLPNYSRGGDYYAAAAFLESGRKSAVLFTGRKGLGGGWYGTRCSEQGFHDTLGYRPQFLFYDPEQLGKVARGDTAAYAPLPYASVDLNEQVIPSNTLPCNQFYLHALGYDRARNILYGLQKNPGDAQVVHVWKVKAYAAPDTSPLPPPAACRPDTVRVTVRDTVRLRDTVRVLDTLYRVPRSFEIRVLP